MSAHDHGGVGPQRTNEIATKVEAFVRDVVAPYEQDERRDHHGAPLDELVIELRDKARAAGVLTPHILPDGSHFTQRETAIALIKTGLSPLGPLACNTMAPDAAKSGVPSKGPFPSTPWCRAKRVRHFS